MQPDTDRRRASNYLEAINEYNANKQQAQNFPDINLTESIVIVDKDQIGEDLDKQENPRGKDSMD